MESGMGRPELYPHALYIAKKIILIHQMRKLFEGLNFAAIQKHKNLSCENLSMSNNSPRRN